MTILKCKMCGGSLNLVEDASTVVCEFCGSVQTVPKVDDEKKLTLFARANRLRAACQFDKAAGLYEAIVADFPEEAEAYWGLVLCKYGIEYVDDPATGKKIPTCHRSSFDSIMDDGDLDQAIENADVLARKVYREQAKVIEEVRKGIIAVSANEDPYDIFICYKETAENGDRTLDSVLAQDIYDALTDRDYRVFFARISLEDKLGQEYEPYIFGALNSSKIMLAFGTDYEYFNAVWVKNEWSRFLKLMAQDKTKHLIPCYKGIDAYDMPKEFAKLQAQDLGKVGAVQDLLRGIEKLLPKKKHTVVIQEKAAAADGNHMVASILDRARMAIEDGDWEEANGFFEDALNHDSKNAQAYLGKVLVQCRCRTFEEFIEQRKAQIVRGEKETLRLQTDEGHIRQIAEKYTLAGYVAPEQIRKLYVFNKGYLSEAASLRRQYGEEEKYWKENKLLARAEHFAAGEVEENFQGKKKALFSALSQMIRQAEIAELAAKEKLQEAYQAHIAAADQQAEQMYQEGLRRKDAYYGQLEQQLTTETDVQKLGKNAAALRELGDYKDSKSLAEQYDRRIEAIRAEQAAAAERARILREKRKRRRRKSIAAAIVCAAVIALVCGVPAILATQVWIPAENQKKMELRYNEAEALLVAGQPDDAQKIFRELEGFRNSDDMLKAIQAVNHLEYKNYEFAIRKVLASGFSVTVRYDTDSTYQIKDVTYHKAEEFAGLATAKKQGYHFAGWQHPQWEYVSEKGFTFTFKAAWTDNWEIKYIMNGGIAANPVEYHTDGGPVSLKVPTKSGYTFLGWTGTDVAEDTPVIDLTIPAGSYGDRTYIANWRANTYTIRFDAAGGTLKDESKTVTYDAQYTLPIPSKQGYVFDGWYMQNTKFESGQWNMTQDVRLVARWKLKEYTIRYHVDRGTNSAENPTSYTIAMSAMVLHDPVRHGHKFAGWYTDSEYTNQVTAVPVNFEEDIDLYAKWELIQYSITYHLNGGTNSPQNPTSYTISTEKIYLQDPTKDGYEFLGWYSDSSFTTRVYVINKGSEGDVHLYAKWEKASRAILDPLKGGLSPEGNTCCTTNWVQESFAFCTDVKDSAQRNKAYRYV